MSSPRDYPDEMTTGLPFDDRTAESILRGRRAAVDEADHALIDALGAIRLHAATPPQPNAALLDVFAEGIDDPAQHTASEQPRPDPVATRGRGRIRGLLRPVAVRVAALGLMTKASLAATAVAAAALGGAGAAGILPGQTDGSPPRQEPSTDVPAETEEPQNPTDTLTERPRPSQEQEPPQQQEPSQELTTQEPRERRDQPINDPTADTAPDDALPTVPEQLPDPAEPDLDRGFSETDDTTGKVTDDVTDSIDDLDDVADDPTSGVGETVEDTVENTIGSIETSDVVNPKQDDDPELDGEPEPLSLP